MMLTSGGRFAGYGFYLLKGKPIWLWNMVDLERLKWEGADALPPGRHTVEFDFKYDGKGAGTLAFNSFSGVGGPGTGGGSFDGFWPEQGVPAQPLTVLAALGVQTVRLDYTDADSVADAARQWLDKRRAVTGFLLPV